jgi:tetratricopeptide (TPR) repeat protein
MFILQLYLPLLRNNKLATDTDNIILDLWFKKTSAYAISDKSLLLREGFGSFNNLSKYDLRTVINGPSYYLWASIIFSYSGLSFFLGKKIFSRTKPQEDGSDPRGAIYYQVAKLLHAFFSGNLEKDLLFNENLVTQNLRIGEVLFTTYYYIHLIFQHIEKGNFEETETLIQGLSNIIEAYRCDYAKSNLLYVTARLLFKMRKIPQAIDAAEKSITYAGRTGDLLVLSQTYSIKARMHILVGDIENAQFALKKAGHVDIAKMYPLYSSEVALSYYLINVTLLESRSVSNSGNFGGTPHRKIIKSGKKAERIVKKAVYNSVELYRYMGLYYWQAHKRNKAFKYWGRSIENGRAMGARPELARTYLEVGRHLLDEKGEQKTYNSLGAEDYLDMAKRLFEDMDLSWALEQELATAHPQQH